MSPRRVRFGSASTARLCGLVVGAVLATTLSAACTTVPSAPTGTGSGASANPLPTGASPGTGAANAPGSRGTTAAVTPSAVTAALAAIAGFVKNEMTSTGGPGIAVGVVYQDKVVFTKGYGVREVGKPDTVDPDTVFQIASMSKRISSTVGRGVIAWDQPVHAAEPNVQLSDDYVTTHVTFADLYSHRSGLPGQIGDTLEAVGFSRDQIFQKLRYAPLAPFRTTYAYSNFAMTLAGDAAAKAAAVSFEDLMQQQLFGPAGMTSTSARYADFLARPDRATIHIFVNGSWVPGPLRNPDAQARPVV